MSIEHIDFIVEEPSMEAFLQVILPRLLREVSFTIYSFQSKNEMLKRLPNRLRGYTPWLPENHRIVVIVDRDGDDCKELKRRLETFAQAAGLFTRQRRIGAHFSVINRIAIEELEAWYFGDWAAVCAAYPGVSPTVVKQKGFRDPDQITGGTWEAFERLLKKAGYFKTGLRKLEAARTIAAHIDPMRNTSPSFQKLRDAILELVSESVSAEAKMDAETYLYLSREPANLMYQTVIEQLRTAYDRKVDERAQKSPPVWKVEERSHFLQLLQAEQKQTLLEIGAGTGQDSLFFQENGFTVTCTDLSPEMVKHCRAQGLNADVMDFAHLAFSPESFDAVYARNCLLHVPKADFPGILQQIRALLRPSGLFFLGQYGGVDQEGVWEGDHYEPKRFFARYLDEQIKAIVTPLFELVYFRAVLLDDGSTGHFQSMILRK